MVDERVACAVCGKSFAAKESLEQHTKDAHGPKPEAAKPARKLPTGKVLGLVVVVLLVAGGAYAYLNPAPSSGPPTVLCQAAEGSALHIHAHLDVFVDGVPALVPANIGVTNSCLYWLHTHDSSQVIHIESPVQAVFELGQFLEVWDNSLAQPKLPEGTPSVYVNGAQVSSDFKKLPLNAHDEIALVYGTPPASIPGSYQFPPGT